MDVVLKGDWLGVRPLRANVATQAEGGPGQLQKSSPQGEPSLQQREQQATELQQQQQQQHLAPHAGGAGSGMGVTEAALAELLTTHFARHHPDNEVRPVWCVLMH